MPRGFGFPRPFFVGSRSVFDGSPFEINIFNSLSFGFCTGVLFVARWFMIFVRFVSSVSVIHPTCGVQCLLLSAAFPHEAFVLPLQFLLSPFIHFLCAVCYIYIYIYLVPPALLSMTLHNNTVSS